MQIKRRAIVIPDQHFPIHDQKAVNVVLKAIEMVKPDTFINLGDVGEWESVSAWKYKGKKLPPLEFQLPLIDEEIKQVNKGIDMFDKVLDKVKCNKRYICAGNHDEWLDAFVERYPYMKDYTFRKACRWKERGYQYREYNHPLKIGNDHCQGAPHKCPSAFFSSFLLFKSAPSDLKEGLPDVARGAR